jgi:hypothetical protein
MQQSKFELMDKSWTRVIALIAGIVFFSVGIALTYQAVRAGAIIDVHDAVLSGKIHSGNVGIVIMFFSTMIVISSLAFGDVDEHGQRRKISSFLWGMNLFVITISLIIFNAAKSFEGFGLAAVLVATTLVVIFVTMAATQFLQDQ